jgi:hypothetical protein
MIDPAQAALFLIIIVLSILLVILGIQVFIILRELRKTINKVNKVLDDTGVITESVSAPISNFSTLLMGLKTGATVASLLNLKKKKNSKHNE